MPEKKNGRLASVQQINIDEYNYPLPDERIAKFPLNERVTLSLPFVFYKWKDICPCCIQRTAGSFSGKITYRV